MEEDHVNMKMEFVENVVIKMELKQELFEEHNKENNKKAMVKKKKKKRLKVDSERQQRFRDRTRIVADPMKMKVTIEDVWQNYPNSHFSTRNDRTTSNDDYGMHGKLHNFSDYVKINEWQYTFGSLNIGLCYENDHSKVYRERELSKLSELFLRFLLTIKKYLLQKYKSMHHIINSPMRVSCINGAKTRGHTDCDKGSGPTFVLLEKDDGFVLSVRQFPTFHSSVVQFKNKLYIPHKYSDNEGLIMIQYYGGKLTYHIFPCHVVEEVEPYGDIVGYNIIGIKENKLQVVSDKFKIHKSVKGLPMIKFEQALEIAKNNRKYKTDYKRKYKYIQYKSSKKGDKNKAVHCLYLWKHIHRWLPGSNHLSRRIYVFFRPIREETPSQRLRHNAHWKNWIVLDEEANVLDEQSIAITPVANKVKTSQKQKFSKYRPLTYHTLKPYSEPDYIWVNQEKLNNPK